MQIVVSYSDQTSSSYLGATQLSNSNGVTAVTICSAPAASTIRDVDMISVLNSDSVQQVVVVQLVDTSTVYQIISVSLSIGDKLTFTHGSGWQVVSNSGNIKYTVLSTSGVDSFSAGSTGLTPATATTGAVTLAGTLAIGSGGTGQTTQAAAITALAGTQTSGYYLRSNGTNTLLAAIQAGDVPALSYVSSVSGTTGRTTSSGGLTPAIDLVSGIATPGTTGSSTLVPVITIDTYGRVTSITTAANPQGTVTSVAALTLGTTGTDLSSTVATGTTTPVITLNVPTASASNRGALSAADWTTFNNKGSGTVTSVTGTSPVTSSGGTTPAISLATGYGDTQNPYASKTAAYVLAAPSGVAGVPTFRAIVSTDVPTLNQNTSGTAANITATSNSTITTLSALSLPGSQVSGNISGNAANVTGTVAIANGGTGQTTAAAAFNALSPITTAGDLILGNGVNSATRLAIGANSYVLTSNGTTASWQASSGGGVSSFSAGTTGFTPSTATTGAITLAGTLGIANGGTSVTTTPTNGQLLIGNGTNYTVATLTAGSNITITNSAGGITIASTSSSGGAGNAYAWFLV
jgi:hypothetical protein